MRATGNKCRDCAGTSKQNSTRETGKTSPSDSKTPRNLQGRSSSDPPVISNKDGSDGDTDPPRPNNPSLDDSFSVDSPEENPSVQLYYQPTVPDGFPHLTSCYIFGLGIYRSKTKGRNQFSQELIKFAKKCDLDKFDYFAPHIEHFFEDRLDGRFSPDAITVYPSHSGNYSEALIKICKKVEADYSIPHQELLSRVEERPQQKEYDENKKRWENQSGSISGKRSLSGETVIILDDVTTTGASITVGKNQLVKQGASQVIGLCLAISKRPGDMYHRLNTTQETVGSVINDG
jgi:hypothetical protein